MAEFTALDVALLQLRALVQEHEAKAKSFRRSPYKHGSWERSAEVLAETYEQMAAICKAKIRGLEGDPAPGQSTAMRPGILPPDEAKP